MSALLREPSARASNSQLSRLGPPDGSPSIVLCECGCGEAAPLARKSNTAKGHIKGQPVRFRVGHSMRGRTHTDELKRHLSEKLSGEGHPRWKGGRNKTSEGYIRLHRPEHPHASKLGWVYEHRLIAEQTLGRLLAPTEVVHHLNGIPDDNRPENLAVLSSQSEHMALHNALRQASE